MPAYLIADYDISFSHLRALSQQTHFVDNKYFYNSFLTVRMNVEKFHNYAKVFLIEVAVV